MDYRSYRPIYDDSEKVQIKKYDTNKSNIFSASQCNQLTSTELCYSVSFALPCKSWSCFNQQIVGKARMDYSQGLPHYHNGVVKKNN